MKYLTFTLAGQLCGIELSNVRELLGYMPFTPGQHDHPAVVGLLNLRGQTVRVVDLRVRFGLPVTRTDDTVMIVAQTCGVTFAIIVDNVVGLENLTTVSAFTPHQRVRIDPGCVGGIASVQDRSIALLDLACTLIVPPPLPKAA